MTILNECKAIVKEGYHAICKGCNSYKWCLKDTGKCLTCSK